MGVDHVVPGTGAAVPAVAEWTVLRALRWPGRWFPSVVRVLVGPAGVFVIAAHPTTATVTLGEDRVWVGKHPDVQSLTDVTDAALVVAQHAGPHAAHVQPVLCFTSTSVSHRLASGVLCTSVHELVSRLAQRPAVLGAGEIDDVVTRLRIGMRAEVDCEPATADPGFEPVAVGADGASAPSVRSGGRIPSGVKAVPAAVSTAVSTAMHWVFRGGLAARFAVLTVVTLVMLAYGPGALSPIGDAVGKAFSDATTPAACPAAGTAAGTTSAVTPTSSSSAATGQEPQGQSEQAQSGQDQQAQPGQAGASVQVPSSQTRAQWTPTGLTVAAHPICRGR